MAGKSDLMKTQSSGWTCILDFDLGFVNIERAVQGQMRLTSIERRFRMYLKKKLLLSIITIFDLESCILDHSMVNSILNKEVLEVNLR